MKKCYICKIKKPDTDFYKSSLYKRGYSLKCKDCERLNARDRRQRNPETEKERNKRYYEKHRLEIIKKRLDWYHKNKQKAIAHEAVKKAIKIGVLVKKCCNVCGKEKSQAHHDDYSKQLEVIWLCATHHRRRHTDILGW